jgi:hypothetical protein
MVGTIEERQRRSDSWLRSEADILELLRIAVHLRLPRFRCCTGNWAVTPFP